MVNSYLYGTHKRTLLHKAAEIGDWSICDLLIHHGANVREEDARLHMPLWLAAEKGHGDICSLLIEKGALVSEMDGYMRTPLCIAASNSHEEVCKILINKGANVVKEIENFVSLPASKAVSISQHLFQQLKFWHSEHGKMFNLVTFFLS